jgi:hypothetical protein
MLISKLGWKKIKYYPPTLSNYMAISLVKQMTLGYKLKIMYKEILLVAHRILKQNWFKKMKKLISITDKII